MLKPVVLPSYDVKEIEGSDLEPFNRVVENSVYVDFPLSKKTKVEAILTLSEFVNSICPLNENLSIRENQEKMAKEIPLKTMVKKIFEIANGYPCEFIHLVEWLSYSICDL